MGRQIIDLTGRRCNRLTVLRRVGNRGPTNPCWECECDCGRKTTKLGANIRSEDAVDCNGCDGRRDDLIGREFGLLSVVAEKKHKGHARLWECKCKCGGLVIKSGRQLMNKRKRHSCGCGPPGPNPLNLVGQEFDLLTVIELAGRSDRVVKIKIRGKEYKFHPYLWRCLCKCGNEKLADTYNLRGRSIRSCGCMRNQYSQGIAGCPDEERRSEVKMLKEKGMPVVEISRMFDISRARVYQLLEDADV